jgi:TetR/AcrR family transcriptional repressor of nem operon
MRYNSEHKARTRERVLKEASEAIRADGAANVGVADIMSRAGLTHGGFYAHFKSKDELIAEAITHMFEERYARFFARVDRDEPRIALAGFIDRYLSMQHLSGARHGCPVPTMAGDLPHLPEDARERFAAGLQRLIDALQTLLDRVGLADSAALASSVLAELSGVVGMARTIGDDVRAQTLLTASRAMIRKRLTLDPA